MKEFVFGVLACALLGGALLLGMDTTEGVENGPQAEAILGEAARFLAEQPQFTVEMDMDYLLKVDGEDEVLPTHYTLSMERPARLRLEVKSEEIEIHFVRDEVNLTVYVPSFDQFTIDAVSETPSAVIERAGFGPFSLAIPLVAELAKNNPFEAMLSDSGTVSYVGAETFGGVDCHRIRISHAAETWDVWIEIGEQPVLRRIVPDTAAFVKDMKANGFDGTLSVEASLGPWAFEAKPDAVFAFDVPEGAKRVAAFRPPEPKHVLVGKPAPEFEIDILDGGTFNLAEVKGKEIIILDFWATWCGPCRMAMPILERVAKRFADQDVRLYAVNLEEDIPSIRRFISQQKLGLTTLLDKTGAVGLQYKAHSIPQTVIIGKDGTVQVVHVGYSADLENAITEELTALVKGEKLSD